MNMNGDALNPNAIVDLTDWVSLENADGLAFPHTPARLRDLTSGDFSAVTSSLDHLNSALLNDGVVYSATVPAFRYVAALLGDPPSRAALTPRWEGGKFPLRGKLLAWLANVAFDVRFGQEQRIREWGKYSPTEKFPNFTEIRNTYPEVFPSVASYFNDSDSRVVEVALVAAVRFMDSPALTVRRREFIPLVENILMRSSSESHKRLAVEALSAWRQGGVLIEQYADQLPSVECGGVHDAQGESVDEPPF
ncbi:hypothetical protein ACH4KU_02820 [Streptomyces althioticus]|uniref:hypothetical protein n=1 Tax=Streptomyces althioticus TaxID=83380 RepID=UPI00378BA58D